jgi:phosphate transport system ATP-binding protein
VLEITQLQPLVWQKQALFDCNMEIQKGQVTALIGPSGCGKSTLLRCLNRMNDLVDDLRIDGQIRVDGFDIYGKGVDVIALRKRMGMVFQKPNPFAMSIYDNVSYPLRVDGVTRKSILDETVERALRRPPLGRGQGPPERKRAWACRAASSSACASRAPSPPTPKCC